MSGWQRQSQQPQQPQRWTCIHCGSSNAWHQVRCKGCQTLAPRKVLSVIRQAQEHGPSPRKPGGGQRAQGGAGWGKGARKGEGPAGRRPVAATQPGGSAKGYGKGPRPSHGKGRGSENRKGQGKGGKGKSRGQGEAQQGASPQKSGEAPVAAEQSQTVADELKAAQVLARALPNDTRVTALLAELQSKQEPPQPVQPKPESAQLLHASKTIRKLQARLDKRQKELQGKKEQRAQLDKDIAELETSSANLVEQLQAARAKAAQSLAAPNPQKAMAQCTREAQFLEKVEKFIRELDSEEGGGLRISCDDILASTSRKTQSVQVKCERLSRHCNPQSYQMYGEGSEEGDDEQLALVDSEIAYDEESVVPDTDYESRRSNRSRSPRSRRQHG